MEKLINFTCIQCKEDFTVQPYFGKPHVYTDTDPMAMHDSYTARVFAKAVCPHCGTVNELLCKSPIYSDDIINLATRRYAK